MEFAPWFNREWDDSQRAVFHEAGHLYIALRFKPELRYRVTVGGGEGAVVIHPDDLAAFSDEQLYQIAVAGCLAEAKAAGGKQAIGLNDLVDVRDQIRDGLSSGDLAWPVAVRVGGNPVLSSSNRRDFDWLEGAPNDDMLLAAIHAVAVLLNDPVNWMRLGRRSWKIDLLGESDE